MYIPTYVHILILVSSDRFFLTTHFTMHCMITNIHTSMTMPYTEIEKWIEHVPVIEDLFMWMVIYACMGRYTERHIYKHQVRTHASNNAPGVCSLYGCISDWSTVVIISYYVMHGYVVYVCTCIATYLVNPLLIYKHLHLQQHLQKWLATITVFCRIILTTVWYAKLWWN